MNLWEEKQGRRMQSATANAIDEGNRYLADSPIERTEDPLIYWSTHQKRDIFSAPQPHLSRANMFFCMYCKKKKKKTV